MTTSEIAHRLVELCRASKYAEAQNELYSEDAKSIEPDFAPEPIVQGRDALNGKAAFWEQNFEEHSNDISDPVIAGNYFSISFTVEVTDKNSGARFPMTEIAVFHVKDGKIDAEQFFYENMQA